MGFDTAAPRGQDQDRNKNQKQEKDPERMRTFIFACIHNAGRSQMAAAFFNRLANAGAARALSAGTRPAAQLHPVVVEAMREVGIDLSAAQPQKLTAELAAGAEMLITLGCGEACPFVPGVEMADWPLPDPKGQDIGAVRVTRDEIARRVRELLETKKILG